MTQFQLFDLLEQDEFDSLKADIAKRGVLVPIEFDEEGNILDGHHRHRVCEELGIKDYPRVVRSFRSVEEKEEHVVTLNVRRRHLNSEQKRKWIAWFLERHPERSNRQIGGDVGVSDNTVRAVRRELESTAQIAQLDRTVGKDGKERPAAKPKPPPSVFANSDNQQRRGQAALASLGEQAPSKMLDVKRAERIAREAEADRKRAEPVEPTAIAGDIDIRHGDFREILSDIPDGAVDAIITDPPYPKEYIPLFGDLSELAARILAPHGVLVAMTGQSWIREYLAELDKHMAYRWTAAYIAQGARTRMHIAKVGTGWKPLLIYQRHDATTTPFLVDDLFDAATQTNDGVDKQFHHWGQSEAGIAEQVDRFTKAGQLVVDPFLGGGTTALVCRDLSRRFIGCDLDAAAVVTSRERCA